MSLREEFISVAQKEVGYVEGPKDNETKYGKFTKADLQPWCGSFVMWCAAQVGLKIPNVVSTYLGAERFKGAGRWHSAEGYKPQPGDLVFFDFQEGGNPIDHIGIVLADNGDGTVSTIEGNTTGEKKKKASERNGGEVAVKVRAYKKNKKGLTSFVVGFASPKFN